MGMLLLAARPSEIESEVRRNKEFEVVKETVAADRWGRYYWEIFQADRFGIMKIIRATSNLDGEIEDVKTIYLVVADVEDAAQAAKDMQAAAARKALEYERAYIR